MEKVGGERGGWTNPYIGSLLDDYNPASKVLVCWFAQAREEGKLGKKKE